MNSMNNMTNLRPKITMITLGVSDLKNSTEFYSNGLGFPLSDHSNENVTFLELNGTWLGLYPKHLLAKDANVDAASSGFAGFTLAHNVKTKQEVDHILTLANKAGATIMKPAQDTFWGGYSGYFADRDQYLWEVAWNPHFWIE